MLGKSIKKGKRIMQSIDYPKLLTEKDDVREIYYL